MRIRKLSKSRQEHNEKMLLFKKIKRLMRTDKHFKGEYETNVKEVKVYQYKDIALHVDEIETHLTSGNVSLEVENNRDIVLDVSTVAELKTILKQLEESN